MKAKKKAPTKASPTPKEQRVEAATVVARLVEGTIPYLEVAIREQVTEALLLPIFERVRGEITQYKAKRLLVDLREGSVALTISDMLGLAKLVGATFAGVLERFALVLRPQDVLSEKFFEPSVSNRGVPTFVSTDADEAVYWVTAKLRPLR